MTRTYATGLCPLCGGGRTAGTVTYTTDLGTVVVVVRNVPASVCDQCGESWVNDSTASILEARVRDALQRGAQVEVLSMA
jgi:YgiT-type zinc finger domain-containing protein